jgi:hypothetical protein
MWLQIVPSLQLAISAFLFVMNMRRIRFDLPFNTAAEALGLV